MTTKISRPPSEYEYDKARAEYEAALTLSTGAIAPRITWRDGVAFIGNDASGVTLAEMRAMTAKLRKEL